MTDPLPGSEIPKEFREIARYLVRVLRWRYDNSGKGHPVLLPVDPTKPQLRVPTTPTSDPRALKNFIADVRKRGGIWPPPRKQKGKG